MNSLLTPSVAIKPSPLDRAATSAVAGRRQGQVKFSDLATDRQKQNKEQVAAETAQELIASTLVQPVLDRMIDDPLRSELFHGGEGEKMFQRQANGYLAKNIVRGANFPVVQSVYRKLLNPHPTGVSLNQVI